MATFKTTSRDNTEVEVVIAGARSAQSNLDASSTVYANYDNDTSNCYRLAEIAVRDHFGSAQSNGFGDLIFRTNGTGILGSGIDSRMIILYNGNVGINHLDPQYTLEVGGTANFSNVFIRGKVVNSGRQPSVLSFTPVSIAESNVFTKAFSYIINPLDSGVPSRLSVSSYLLPKAGENIASSNYTYSLRAYDFTNRQVVGQLTASNSVIGVQSFTLSNVDPLNNSVIELQAKKNNAGVSVQLEAVNIFF